MNKVADQTFAAFDNPISKKILSEIESSGAKLIKLQLLETELIAQTNSAEYNIANFKDFDWLIFPDVLSVDFFVRELEQREIELFELDALRICSFGEVVADQLRFSQIHTDVIPSKNVAETTLTALKAYIGADRFDGLTFLVPKEISQTIKLVKELEMLGATVLEIPVYQIKPAEKSEFTRFKRLLLGGAIDEFVFTAPTDFLSLKHLFGHKSLNEIFSEVKTTASDSVILQTLKEHDFNAAVLFKLPKIDKVNL